MVRINNSPEKIICLLRMEGIRGILVEENLDGITSTLKSDHMNNLLQTVDGDFLDDKEKMIEIRTGS